MAVGTSNVAMIRVAIRLRQNRCGSQLSYGHSRSEEGKEVLLLPIVKVASSDESWAGDPCEEQTERPIEISLPRKLPRFDADGIA